MDLYLIRHGETVDNVAGLYAGVRDSQLTNHGVDQTKRLGEHFAKRQTFTHIFASPLTRALKTAQAIQSAQPKTSSNNTPVAIVEVQELIEQNFGTYEGKTFHARTEARKTGREAHREQHKDDPGFVDVESKESMNKRADVFLDEHLMPLFTQTPEHGRLGVAIVSHGILLSHLWRRILLRLPPKSVSVEPAVTAARGPIVLQHLGGWSNTGYLELAIDKVAVPSHSHKDGTAEETATTAQETAATVVKSEPHASDFSVSSDTSNHDCSAADAVKPGSFPGLDQAGQQETAATTVQIQKFPPAHLPSGWTTVILAVDRKDHLVGLKRQRGGIGRSAHDDKQGKLESFFKKQRTS